MQLSMLVHMYSHTFAFNSGEVWSESNTSISDILSNITKHHIIWNY